MNRSIKNNQRLLSTLLPVLLFAASCTTEGGTTVKEVEEIIPAVETASVQEMKSAYTLDLPGEILPYEQVKLYPKVKGFVKEIYVDRGSHVRKGQLLALLEAPEITQASLAASAKKREVLENIQYSGQAYERLQRAAENKGAVAALELEQAKAKLMADSAKLQSLDAEMAAADQLAAYLKITAPFDGIVSSRNVSQGALVGTNDTPLFSLAQQDRLRLTLAIPEKHARALADSTVIQYRLSNYPDEIFTSTISRHSGVMDPSIRSLVVEFDLDNTDKFHRGGEYVQVKVPFQNPKPSLWVPSSSVVDAPSGVFVLKVEDDAVQKVGVKAGIRKEGLTEVFGELQPEDLVVIKGSEELREGTKIAIQ